MENSTASAREVLGKISTDYHAAIHTGEHHPFVWPYNALGPYILTIYLLLPPTQSPIVHLARYPIFLLILYFSVTAILDCQSPAVTVGYGIGLLNSWTILWSATFLIFTDGRNDYKRIERQERPEILASKDDVLVENFQGETSALDGSTKDGLKSLHPMAESPQITLDTTTSPEIDYPEISSAQDPVSSPFQTYIWQSLPTNLSHRLDFILDLVTNFRGLRWTHQAPGTFPPPTHIRESLTSPSPPPSLHSSSYPTRRQLLTQNLPSFILNSLALDTLKALTAQDPYFLSLLFTYTSLLNIFLLAPLGLACLLGPRILGPHASPWLYPPSFGPMSAIADKGLAGLWGGWWHQLFRYAFESAGEFIGGTCLHLPKKSTAGAAVRVTVAFWCSGFLHACASYTVMGNTHPMRNSFAFFAVQPVGILAQRALSMWLRKEGYREAIPVWMRRVGNVMVVVGWCVLTGPLVADDFAAAGIWLYEPLPVSLVRGLRGEGWWRWGGEWVRWYSGTRWWRSGLVFLGG